MKKELTKEYLTELFLMDLNYRQKEIVSGWSISTLHKHWKRIGLMR